MESSRGLLTLGVHEYSTNESFPRNGVSQADREELQRVKMHLQQVTKKNQELEEKLLLVTQELEKEKENSRGIVLTLTERLMESRETINKLEMENMRYKKDCMLAMELLQCNRKEDQGRVTSTMKKLSEYSSESQAKRNVNKHPTSTTKGSHESSTNEEGKTVFQRGEKPPRTADRKTKVADVEKVANINTSRAREKGLWLKKDGNEAVRLILEESPVSIQDSSPAVGNGALSEHAQEGLAKKGTEVCTQEGTLFANEKLRVTEGKKSVAPRPRNRSCGQEDSAPLMEDNAGIKQEYTPGRNEFEEDDKLIHEKPTETLKEKVISTQLIQKEPLPQKDKPLTQNDNTLDEHTQLIKESPSLEKNISEPLTNLDTPFKPKAQRGKAFEDTPLITQDNIPAVKAAECHGVLSEENKQTEDGDIGMKENATKLLDGGATEVALLNKGKEVLTGMDEIVSENYGEFVQKGTSLAEENNELQDDGALSSEDGKFLIHKDISGSKSLVGKEKNEDMNNAPTDKEAEDDTAWDEENTPLV